MNGIPTIKELRKMSNEEFKKKLPKIVKEIKGKIEFVDHQGILPAVLVGLKTEQNILLQGKTGTGKTMLVYELAKIWGKKLYILNMEAGKGIEEIKGHWNIGANGEMRWIYGELAKALKEGWCLMNEANYMNEEQSSILYPIMDFQRHMVLDDKDGEVIDANNEFALFLTQNPGYYGTNELNSAIKDRCGVTANVEYLPETEEAKLLMRRTVGLKKDTAEHICKFAKQMRDMAVENEEIRDIGTRTLEVWALAIANGLDPITAANFTILGSTFDNNESIREAHKALKFIFEGREPEPEVAEEEEEDED